MATIKYNKAKAKAHQDELVDIRDKMKTIRDKQLEVKEGRIDAVWNGEASEAFITKMNKLETHMTTTISKINSLIQDLKEACTAIESTEKENTSISS